VVLLGLGALAPVQAVRGNCDRGEWCAGYPERLTAEVAGVKILVLHDRHELQGEPPGGGIRVVVSGHSHKPSVEERQGVLYLNPGSAGRRRFHLPVTLALLTLERGAARAEIVELVGEHTP
jgi:putative phosphoesterase